MEKQNKTSEPEFDRSFCSREHPEKVNKNQENVRRTSEVQQNAWSEGLFEAVFKSLTWNGHFLRRR